MSNRFKYLDSYFPCGDERLFGEVVGISITASRSFVFNTHEAFVKRKQWYRNASVNAWHLHRAMCRELKAFDAYSGLHKQLTAVVGDIVEVCYLSNYVFDTQYSSWELCAIDWGKDSKLDKFCTLLLSSDGVAQREDEQLANCKELILWLRASAQAKKLRKGS